MSIYGRLSLIHISEAIQNKMLPELRTFEHSGPGKKRTIGVGNL